MSAGAEAGTSALPAGMRRLARRTASALSSRRAWTSAPPPASRVPSATHRRRFAASTTAARAASGPSGNARPAGHETFGTAVEDARTSSGVGAGPSRASSPPGSGVVAPFAPSGDQPAAIARCVELLRDEKRKVACLRGATGTGKTFVVAHVVDALTREKPRPTLVVVPNKTLAAQVARELRGYLPKKRVELFVSHFSLYVPESFSKGRYVEKRSAIDVDLDALRHRATKALLESDETVIVASVSCLYGLGLPADYVDARLTLDAATKQPNGRDALGAILEKRLLYSECREGGDFVKSGQWAWETGSRHGQKGTRKLIVWPPYERAALELELDPDGALVSFARQTRAAETKTKTRAETATTTTAATRSATPEPPETAPSEVEERLTIWPRQHHITPPERLEAATAAIAREAAERAAELRAGGDHIEADRLEQRVGADVGLLREIGWCPGAEHYSRHLAGRHPGAPPVTLLDYLGFDSSASSSNDQKSIQSGSREWLLVADESHVMLPQLRAMHGGDRSRKLGLVRGGYRLPSALDNRPLNFDEFWARVPKALLVSATPGETEAAWCASGLFDVAGGGGPEGLVKNVPSASASEAAKEEKEGVGMVDMVVRPSGVLDPEVTILPRKEQLPALAAAVRRRAARGEASLVCALTKTDCEDLAGYLCAIGGVRADWLHSGLTAKERAVKLQRLQQGELDCLVGAQLLREGLDVPQVSLVIVLDAGVPGFARSSRSLMQMMGRAARNKRGEAILFADEPHTPAMNEAVAEVARRREKQKKHNERFGVTPRTASRGSASASLSLFEVMASEIAETREAIDAVSLGDRGRASRAVRAEDDEEALGASADADGDAVFAPSEEEVERAMRAWRLRRAGADADAAAAASAAAEARARKEAVAQEVGPVWNALARDFTERQFTEALFSATPGDAPELEAGRGEGSSAEGRRVFDEDKEAVETLDTLLGAEAVLRAFGGDHAHVASLRALVRDLPAKTGVYRWLDASGQVLYVGKAKNLRSRTGGYLAPSLLRASPRHRSLLSRARGVDAVLTPGGERDALLLEARMIQRIKPPLNVLLKHAPRPDAARIVATLDDPVAPRFFVVDASNRKNGGAGKEAREKNEAISRTRRGPAVGGGGGGGVSPRGGGGGGGSRLAFDGIGGRVSPGTVAAARGAFEAAASEAAGGDVGVDFFGGFSDDGSSSTKEARSTTPPREKKDAPRTRFWLRPSRADARRALSDLERALDLRALAFRARHGDAEAKERLRENAAVAADALDGGAAAEAAASRLETAGDAAAAAAIRAAAAPEASALGALSALLQEAALAEAEGGRALSLDVVAAAAHGKHCAVQIVKVRDGAVVDVFAATAHLPRRSFSSSFAFASEDVERLSRASLATDRGKGRTERSASDPSPIVDEAVQWLGEKDEDAPGSERDAEAAAGRSASPEENNALKSASEKVETETALGEATQLCLESYYALGGGGGSRETDAFDADDAPERVYVPHELPDAAGLERILRAVERAKQKPSAAATDAPFVFAGANGVARDDAFFDDDERDGPTDRRTKKKSVRVRDGTLRRGPVLRHGSELPPGLPSALASLARANAAEAARKAADAADAAASLAATLGVSRGGDDASLVVEGIDISHLAGANTSASVVVFVNGAPAPERHRRYEIETGGAGVAKGDDPAAVRAAMAKRVAAARRAVSGKRAAAAAAAAESGARVPGALPDLALIDGGAAQLVAAARACLEAGVEVTNARFSEEAKKNVPSSKKTAENPDKKASGPFSFSVALASLAKGRVSGEESMFVPRAVVDASGTIVDFTADRLVVGPGAAATRAGKAAAADGPGLRLLRAVRDESHAVALGAQRSRRRASLFREMRSARDDEVSVATG